MPADAAPAIYYKVPGGASEGIYDLTTGGDGTLWVLQQEGEGARVLHLDGSGNLIAASPPLESVGEIASDGGGVWVTGREEMFHVASDGTVAGPTPIEGQIEPNTLVKGADGRDWALACVYSYSGADRCDAIAANPAGEIDAYPLPALDIEWPAGHGGSLHSWAVPTASSGVWFERMAGVGSGPQTSYVSLISYLGGPQKVETPSDSWIFAPAAPGAVWWLKEEGLSGARAGWVDSSGVIGGERQLPNVSQGAVAYYSAGAGRGDALLWAQNGTWNESYDGQIGVIRPDGSSAEYKVEHGATAIPTTVPELWSGNCTFGMRLHETADGSLWTVTGGHPDRVTRQQPSGAFETYALGGIASEFAGEAETYIVGMVETEPHSLYFALNTPSGPELASVDPYSPPPPEPRLAESSGQPSSEAEARQPDNKAEQKPASRGRVRAEAFLAQVIRKVRLALQRSRPRKVVRVRMPEAGRVRILIRGAHKQVLADVVASGQAGVHTLRLGRVNTPAAPRRRHSLSTTLLVRFKPAGEHAVSRSAKVVLRQSAVGRPTARAAVFDGKALLVRLWCPRRFGTGCRSSVFALTGKGSSGRAMTLSAGAVEKAGSWRVVKLAVKRRYRSTIARMTRHPRRKPLLVRQSLGARGSGGSHAHVVYRRYEVRSAG